MEAIKAIEFAAKVQIGTEISGYGNQIMVVTGTNKYGFVGYSKYAFDKFGKKKSTMGLSYSTIMNPHYSGNLKILN